MYTAPCVSYLTLDRADWNCISIVSIAIVHCIAPLQSLLTGENVNSGDIEAILSGFEHLASQVHTGLDLILSGLSTLTDTCIWVAAYNHKSLRSI